MLCKPCTPLLFFKWSAFHLAMYPSNSQPSLPHFRMALISVGGTCGRYMLYVQYPGCLTFFVLFCFPGASSIIPRQRLAHLYKHTAKTAHLLMSGHCWTFFLFALQINGSKSLKCHVVSVFSIRRVHCGHRMLSIKSKIFLKNLTQ